MATLRVDTEASGGRVQVSDMMGRPVFAAELENGTDRIEFQVDNWKPGIYIVEVKMKKRRPIAKRLVVTENR